MNDSGSKGNLAPHKGCMFLTSRPLLAGPAVEALFGQFEQGGWHITQPIQRNWASERDQATLTAGLDPNSALIVREILKRLKT